MKYTGNLVYGSYPEDRLDLYRPDGEAHALFLYFHGGGLEAGSRRDTGRMAELFTKAGIAFATADYRMYPDYGFPAYLEDSAAAVSWAVRTGLPLTGASRLFVGGSSAGGYISMMLFSDPKYLSVQGLDPAGIDGYIFDAGQPTVHFNVLRYDRGLDPRLVRLDEAAPIYFIDHDYPKDTKLPALQFFYADHDMYNRLEQNQLMIRTLLHFGYPEENIRVDFMENCRHCQYTGGEDFCRRIIDFIGEA